jgi:hypothetical protein
MFRVHLFNHFCRNVFIGCWKEETVLYYDLGSKNTDVMSFSYLLLLYKRSSRVQGFMSRSRHIVTSQAVYGCFRKWVDTRRNVSMEWKTPPLLDGYVTLRSLAVRVSRALKPETQTNRSDYVSTYIPLSQEAAGGRHLSSTNKPFAEEN